MLYLGVDLGGTNIKAALVNSEGEILCEANTCNVLSLRQLQAQRCNVIADSFRRARQVCGGVGFAQNIWLKR